MNPVADAIRRTDGIEPADVAAGLQDALAHPGPTLVDVVTDANVLSMPPHITAEEVKGSRSPPGRSCSAAGSAR